MIHNMNPDEYYNRKEVSNSDLTELKNLLHPRVLSTSATSSMQ